MKSLAEEREDGDGERSRSAVGHLDQNDGTMRREKMSDQSEGWILSSADRSLILCVCIYIDTRSERYVRLLTVYSCN